mmetsp:Transcript_59558/g.128889  ORF Transcript_59558/g.128889 Transcript_59558/m.128889 type:complete len:200 (+) Transcript_59558:232-831(+)
MPWNSLAPVLMTAIACPLRCIALISTSLWPVAAIVALSRVALTLALTLACRLVVALIVAPLWVVRGIASAVALVKTLAVALARGHAITLAIASPVTCIVVVAGSRCGLRCCRAARSSSRGRGASSSSRLLLGRLRSLEIEVGSKVHVLVSLAIVRVRVRDMVIITNDVSEALWDNFLHQGLLALLVPGIAPKQNVRGVI